MDAMNTLNRMFGKIAPGMCRLSMNGGIAVSTANGYKSYNTKTNRLTNCTNFVFDIGEDFFFVIPTNKVEPGDIILVNGKPRCVVKADNTTITVINYEDSTVESILPERHVFMGNTYFYGKIVSMFGDNFTGKKKGIGKMMSYMMMSEILKGSGGTSGGNAMMPMMMFMGGGSNPFEEMFSFDDSDDDESVVESEDE